MFCCRFQPPLVHGAASYPVLQIGRAPSRAAEGSADRASRHDRVHLLDAGDNRRKVIYQSTFFAKLLWLSDLFC